MKRSRTVTIVILVVMLLLAAFIAITSILQHRETEQMPAAQQSQQNLPAGGATTASATPTVDPTVMARVEAIHQHLDPDTSKAPEVVTAWMTAFTTRASADDTLWEQTVAPWTAEELLGELEESSSEHIGAQAPTTFVRLQLGDPVQEWGRDTPIRWSRQVTVTFRGADDQEYLSPYRVQAQRGDEGWIITSASYNGMTIKAT